LLEKTDLKLTQSENKASRTRALLKATDEEDEKLKIRIYWEKRRDSRGVGCEQ
jgi:hypothetical protein